MALYRQAEVGFWTDPDFEKVDFTTKAVYQYLYQNPMSNLVGIYRLHKQTVLAQTNLKPKELDRVLGVLSKDLNKIVLEGDWVWIKGASKRIRGRSQIRGAFKLFSEVPDELEIKKLYSLKYKHLARPSPHPPKTPLQSSGSCIGSGKKEKEVVYYNGNGFRILDKLKQELIDKAIKTFGDLDIEQELERADGWLLANPEKHRKNYNRFVWNWLLKAEQLRKEKKDGRPTTSKRINPETNPDAFGEPGWQKIPEGKP